MYSDLCLYLVLSTHHLQHTPDGYDSVMELVDHYFNRYALLVAYAAHTVDLFRISELRLSFGCSNVGGGRRGQVGVTAPQHSRS